MPSLKEIRDRAKRSFKSRYWVSVGLLGLIALVLNLWQLTPLPFIGFGVLMTVLVGLVLTQGSFNVGLSLAKGSPLSLYTAFSPFEKYGRNLGGCLWYTLFIFLWELIALFIYFIAFLISVFRYLVNGLFDYIDYNAMLDTEGLIQAVAVPVIISAAAIVVICIFKSLQYFCARYLLLDCPNVPATSILELSKRIMKGEKKNAFLLVLSVMWPYLAVLILSIVFSSLSTFESITGGSFVLASGYGTAGIILNIAAIALSVLYYQPYAQSACGIFYYEVKAKALTEGKVTYAELGEIPPLAPNGNLYIEPR